MSVYDEVQMQVTKTVRNAPLSHGHRHLVVNATGRSRISSWMTLCSRVDCPTRQSKLFQIVNVSHLRPINTVLHRTAHLVGNKVEVGAVGRPQIRSNESRNLSLQ